MSESNKVVNIPVTRDELRAALLNKQQARSETVVLFGQDIEIRQPTLASILDIRDDEDNISRTVAMIINYAYVPGTDEKIFGPEDAAAMMNWPWGEDLMTLQDAITRMIGLDVDTAAEDMAMDPLEGS